MGKLAYWFLLLIFVGAAFNAFGLTQVNAVINQILAYLPNVAVALVVLLVGALLAQLRRQPGAGASGTARVGDPGLLAGLARAAVLGFARAHRPQPAADRGRDRQHPVHGARRHDRPGRGAGLGLGGREEPRRILEDWYAGGAS